MRPPSRSTRISGWPAVVRKAVLRGVAGDDRVDGVGGAVDQHVALGQQIGQRQFDPAMLGSGERQRIEHALDRIGRRGRRLVHGAGAP